MLGSSTGQEQSPSVGFFHLERLEWSRFFTLATHRAGTERLFTISHDSGKHSLELPGDQLKTDQQKYSLFFPCTTGGNSWNVSPWKAGEIHRISKLKKGFQQILGHETSSQTSQGCSIPSESSRDAGMERMRHQQQPCALHWTLHKTGPNAAPLWTYRMFLPTLHLNPST